MKELDALRATRQFGASVLVKCDVKSHQRPEAEEGRWVRERPQVFRAHCNLRTWSQTSSEIRKH